MDADRTEALEKRIKALEAEVDIRERLIRTLLEQLNDGQPVSSSYASVRFT